MQREVTLSACGAMVFGVAMLTAEAGQDIRIDRALARQYFNEAQELCREDGGRLWGRTLCGPLLFVSSDTLEAVASEADSEERLREEGDVWVGRLDPGMTRVWLTLEWRALQVAFNAQGSDRHRSLRDAALFRRARHSRISEDARAREIALEMFEGLAEYTGRTGESSTWTEHPPSSPWSGQSCAFPGPTP